MDEANKSTTVPISDYLKKFKQPNKLSDNVSRSSLDVQKTRTNSNSKYDIVNEVI